MRVLIVDDMAAVREGLRILLSDLMGIETIGEAGDIQHASQLLENTQPDVVILDIEMPEALQLARQIKSRTRPPLLIALSVYDHEELRHSLASLGVDLYLDKSLLLPNLVKIVRKKTGGTE